MIRHRHDGTAKHAGNRALLRAAAVGERGHLVYGRLRSLQIMMSADVNNAPRTCADNYDPVRVASKAVVRERLRRISADTLPRSTRRTRSATAIRPRSAGAL